MRRTIFPYETLSSDLDLKLAGIELDGNPIPTDHVLSRDRVVSIFDAGVNDWERMRCSAEIRGHAPSVEAFVKKHGGIELLLVVSCRSTNVRQSFPVIKSKVDPALWHAQIELDRDNFRDKVTIQGILTATINSISHRPVAFTDSWLVYFDPTDSFRVGGALKVSWCDFQAEEAPAIARRFQDAPYVVDLEQSMPVILLNKTFDGLEPLLRDSKERVGAERMLHDITRMSIARSVWLTLVCDAMAAVKAAGDGEEPEWPERSWQKEVLDRVLPEVDTTKSEMELLQLASEEWRTHPGSASFLMRAEAVVGEMINANKTLRKSTQKMLHEGIVT